MEIVLLARALSRRLLESRETLYGGSDQIIDTVIHESHEIEPFLCCSILCVSFGMLFLCVGNAQIYCWPLKDFAEDLAFLAGAMLSLFVTFLEIVVAITIFALLQNALTKIPWLGQTMLVPHFVQRHQAVKVDT